MHNCMYVTNFCLICLFNFFLDKIFVDGSAAAILANEDFVIRHGLQNQAIEILGMEMVTDLPSTFKDKSCMKIVILYLKLFSDYQKHG